MELRKLMVFVAVATCGCDRVPGTDAALERRSRAILTDALFDADSAKFQKMKTVSLKDKDRTSNLICGEVNAKNKLGAYAGFTRFIVSQNEAGWMVDPRFAASDAEIQEAMSVCSRDQARNDDPRFTSTACERSEQLIEQSAQQAGFNAVWDSSCADAAKD